MNNTRFQFPAAKIISYAIIAAEDADSEIKVIGLIAGDQMRGTAPLNYLSHKDIRGLRLTRIEGDRSQHPLVKAFLSWPAANSALVQGSLQPPATPEYNFRVDYKIHYKRERRPTALRGGKRKRASETGKGVRERQQGKKREQTGRKQGRREEWTRRKWEQGGKRNLPGQGSSEQD